MKIRCSYCGGHLEEKNAVKVGEEKYHFKCAVESAKKEKDRYFSSMIEKKNVVGTGIGLGPDGEMRVMINVEKKEALKYLRGKDEIPEMLGDVKTDVVVVGRLRGPRPIGSMVSSNLRRRRYLRPAPGGASVSHRGTMPGIISAGTFGFLIITEKGEKFMVSNNHVFAEENRAEIGDEIYQPGTLDGGGRKDIIGYLSGYVPIKFGSRNYVDAAIASPISGTSVSTEILGIGIPRGFSSPRLGDEVVKSGRTTGVTKGSISQIHVTSEVEYENGTAIFDEQVMITPGGFSAGGDSGSAIVNRRSMEIEALLFGGSDTHTVATPIEMVIKAFWGD